MIKKLALRYKKHFNGLFLVVIIGLAGFILSGYSYSLRTDAKLITSSGQLPAASLPGAYQLGPPDSNEKGKIFISVASDGNKHFGELIIYKEGRGEAPMFPGRLFVNPLDGGWYAVSGDYISPRRIEEQYHFLVRIGNDIENVLFIQQLPEEIFRTLAGHHNIQVKKSAYGDEISVVGQVTKERLLGYLKDIVRHAGPEHMVLVQKIESIPSTIINAEFKKFGDPLLVNNESDLKKLGTLPIFVPYLRSVDQRDIPWGAFLLSRLYLNGWGVENDYELARKYANRSIHLGLEYGKATLGDLALSGYGQPRGIQFALKMFHEAAESGYPAAAAFLGDIYRKGDGVEKNQAEAIKWYLLAAEKGDAKVQYNLGAMYINGEGVSKNDQEAVKWYRKAADQGYPAAQLNLGVMYTYGEGVSKNDQEAVKWYRKAAEHGHVTAQFIMGVRYDNGRGVQRDAREAVAWYRKAAEQGHETAQYNLGVKYAKGEGVSKDNLEAAKWFRRAALQGVALAQYNLALLYEKLDPAQSYAWRIIAANNNHKKAQSSRQEHKASLSLSQIEQAQRIVEEIKGKISKAQ